MDRSGDDDKVRPLSMRVDIVVYDGLDEMDALGPLEVLRRASLATAQWRTRIVTQSGQRTVRGAFGLEFSTDAQLEVGECDIVIVVGGGWAQRAMVGAWGEAERGELTAQLRDVSDAATITAGVCTGTMLLARAGVIGTRRANTHHSAHADLAASGATVVPDRVVDDGNLITSGGVTSGIDLALWLVEREIDRALAERIASNMEYSRFRPQLGLLAN